jgi:predicted KAP-like P-loop ATPase
MWSDNETDRDFLNFGYVADIAAEMIAQAGGRPLSLGVSGSWGVGKSSMMRLLKRALRERTGSSFLFVDFNAWLYQGYDDTRAALMEIIARELLEYAKNQKTPVEATIEKARSLLARVDWFRLVSTGASTAASLALGIPPVGLIAEGLRLANHVHSGTVSQHDLGEVATAAKKASGEAKNLIRHQAPHQETPPKAIHDFRENLRDTLETLGLTLVVLIDDLDRCLPTTTIATLEAVRLFLFLERTAFVIAADDKMIRAAVRAHFKDVAIDDELVTNYFDKLIQVPVRVPPLGTQDVRAYLMMLFVENSELAIAKKEEVRLGICQRLGEAWKGVRVDRAFVGGLIGDCPPALAIKLDLADRIAPILTGATQIAGNPRLIKRFLNTLSIRLSIAKAQKVTVDEAALAKMLLFERCGPEKAYAQLLSAINDDPDGHPRILEEWEAEAAKDPSAVTLEGHWNSPFVREWLTLQPVLSGQDLRGVVYVSRETVPVVTAADRLSSGGADVLEALLALTSAVSPSLAGRAGILPPHEMLLLVEALIARARSVSAWGTPPILWAFLTLCLIEGEHVGRIARFLAEIPPTKLTAAIVPLLTDKAWAKPVLAKWAGESVTPEPVRKAIAKLAKKETS